MKGELGNCEQCTLNPSTYVPWQYRDNPQYPILWVGQAPGSTEIITKVPFTGSAGKMCWRLMKEAGINKNYQVITNTVCCMPPEDRKPKPSEIQACHERLKQEILLVQPELIIALGDVPIKALIGKTGSTKIRGEFHPLLPEWDYECQVLCCLHPSFVMRQRQWIETAVEDFKKIVDFFESPSSIEVGFAQPRFLLDPTDSELAEYLSKSDVITAFDLETSGLNPRKDEIIGCSFYNGSDKAIAVDYLSVKGTPGVVARFLEDEKAKKVTQNGSFDCAFLNTYGIKVSGLSFDTRLAEHLLNSDLPTDLQYLRKSYTNIPPYKPLKREMKFISNMPIEKVKTMCCWDSITTHEVMVAQKKLLTEGQTRVLNNIYLPLVFVLNKMEKKGVKVDINTLAAMYARMAPQAEAIREKYFDPVDVNPNSPKQLATFFGLQHTKKFSTKMTRTDPNEYIDFMIRRGHPEAERLQALLDYRSLTKQMSTTLRGIYNRLEDGFIHTHFHPEGTGTGRISSKNPNLQNIKKLYRIIYTPDDIEHVLLEADYKQLELAVAAVLGKDELLLDQLKKGIKPHHVLGKIMFGRDWDNLTDQEKLREKAVLFGTLGGRSPYSISREFGISVEQAGNWQEDCVRQYPGLLRYITETVGEFKSTGKITTAFGTERKVNTVPQAMNNRFQGSASFVTLTTLIELDKAGFDLRLTVHDSIMLHCLEKEVMDVINDIRKIVERPIKELDNWEFKASYSYGHNWYELKEM